MSPIHTVVAIIDDNAGILDAMRRLLSAYGYRTELYGSAAAFRSAVATTKAICLILDIQLGDDSGIDFAAELVKAGFRFPVIFMSASHDEFAKIPAAETGCIALLRKPFSPEELIGALTQLPPRSPAGNPR
jgi:FixJ family two-component response regulator